MTDPVSASISAVLGGTSLLSGILGGNATAAAQKQQAQANVSMDMYQAAVATQNQQIEKQNAGFALQQGEEQQTISGQATRATVGRIRAAQGASGLDINKGTMPLVPASARTIGQEEQSQIRQNADTAAYAYDVSAWQYGAQSQLDTTAAFNTAAAEPLETEATFLGTAASVSSKWLSFNQSGVFSGVGSSISSGISAALGGFGG